MLSAFDPKKRLWWFVLGALLLLVLTLVVYAPAMHGQFFLDDLPKIVRKSGYQGLASSRRRNWCTRIKKSPHWTKISSPSNATTRRARWSISPLRSTIISAS